MSASNACGRVPAGQKLWVCMKTIERSLQHSVSETMLQLWVRLQYVFDTISVDIGSSGTHVKHISAPYVYLYYNYCDDDDHDDDDDDDVDNDHDDDNLVARLLNVM